MDAWITDAAGAVKGHVTHFYSLNAETRWNDIGGFVLETPYTPDSQPAIDEPDAGIIIEHEGFTFYGSVDEFTLQDGPTPLLTLSGPDDLGLLEVEPLPIPGSPDGPFLGLGTGYRTYTGQPPAATVESIVMDQAGPSAPVERQRFDVIPSGIAGTNVTLDLRFAPTIMEWIAETCRANNLTAVATRSPTGVRQFTVAQSQFRQHSVATPDKGWKLSGSRPKATDVLAGGTGELQNRLIVHRHYPPPARFPRRHSVFLDRSNLDTTEKLERAADGWYGNESGGWALFGSVTIEYGADAVVGDTIPILSPFLPEDAQARISAAVLDMPPGGIPNLQIVAGFPKPTGIDRVVAALSDQKRTTRHKGAT